MNQRDEYQRERHRGEQQGGEQQRDERERYRSALRDTYNPEPQWLREDRQRRGAHGYDDEYDYGRGRYVPSDTGEQGGRGSYAGTGAEWGESSRGASRTYPGGAYDNAYGGSGRDVEQYGGDERGWNEPGFSERGFNERERYRGAPRGAQERPWGERDLPHYQGSPDYGRSDDGRSDYGDRDYGGRDYGGRDYGRQGGHDYSAGYSASRWDSQDFSGGRSRYAPFRVGTGMGMGTSGFGREGFGRSYGGASGYNPPGEYGSYQASDESARHWGQPTGSEYGSRGSWELGARQREGRERGGFFRSFRGLGPKHYKRADERIREDVYERLTDSHDVDARSITVDVNQGNVTLNGTVSERRMRYIAEDLVESVMGVASINNQLKVQQETPASSSSQQAGTPTGTPQSPTSEPKH